MGIWNTIKGWFGVAEKEIEATVEAKVVEPAIEKIKEEIAKIDVEAATKAIETRLAEIAEEKKTVTAKEIKAKVKKTSEPKAAKTATPKAKPAKAAESKPKQPAKPRKKSEPKK